MTWVFTIALPISYVVTVAMAGAVMTFKSLVNAGSVGYQGVFYDSLLLSEKV